MPAFSFLLATLYPLRLVNDPRFLRALAAGAFILMRRRDLEALGGYERLQGTVVADLRLAEMFKRNWPPDLFGYEPRPLSYSDV